MTVYEYQSDDGETKELVYRMGAAPKSVKCGGKVFKRVYTQVQIATQSGWPREHENMGVNPKQIAKQKLIDSALGVPVHYNPKTGNPVYQNRQEEKKHMEALGFFNRDGGYSDAQPQPKTKRIEREERIKRVKEKIAAKGIKK